MKLIRRRGRFSVSGDIRVDAAIVAIIIALFVWMRNLYDQFGVDSKFFQWHKAATTEIATAEKKLKNDIERSNYPSEQRPTGTTEQIDPGFAFRFQSPVDLTSNPDDKKVTICGFNICKPAKVASENPEDDQKRDRVKATLEASGQTLHYSKVAAFGKPAAWDISETDLVHDVSRVTLTREGPAGKPVQRGDTYTLTIECRFPLDPSRTVSATVPVKINTLPHGL